MTDAAYTSIYTQFFAELLDELDDKTYMRVSKLIDLIEIEPNMGRGFFPEYEEDIPPVACRVIFVPGTTKCLYYVVDEKEETIRFFHLGDTRADPRSRFAGVRKLPR